MNVKMVKSAGTRPQTIHRPDRPEIFFNPGRHYLELGIKLPGWKTPEISQWSLEGQHGASNNGHRHSCLW